VSSPYLGSRFYVSVTLHVYVVLSGRGSRPTSGEERRMQGTTYADGPNHISLLT
jgi:hypothetical protein